MPAFFAKQAQSPQAISGQPHFPYSPCNRTTPHTHLPLSINSQKTAKPASPRFAGHTPQPMPGCFPRASDLPYHYQAPKIRRQFRRGQRPAPQIPNRPAPQIPRTCVSRLHRSPTNQPTNSPTLGYTCTAMSLPAWLHVRSWAPTRRDQRSVHSNAHQANSLKFPAPTRGAWASGYGVASRRCVGVDDWGPNACLS